MGRRALHALCCFSLSVAAVVGLAWMLSRFAGLYVESHQGVVVMQVSVASTAAAAPPRDYALPGLQFSAFTIIQSSRPYRAYMVSARYWFVIACCAVGPAAWLLASRRPTVCAGTCASCGYDLRATPDRCPECGTPAATGAA
jgi:hypothetical protein